MPAATAIAMPRLGMTMEEGTVVDWPLAVGTSVAKGDVVLIIENEKSETEIEATASGVFRHVYVEPGETVPCGTLLGAITETADEAFDVEAFASANATPAPAETAAAPAPTPAAESAAPARERTGRKPVAPAARALAKSLGIDPAGIPGSGPGGRVTRQDVEAFAAARERLAPVADGVALEVVREGDGAPVALLPGFGTDASAFAPQTPLLLDAGYALRGINPRGVGLSDAPDTEVYDVAQAASDVAALLDAPAHVVGASLGAATAIELALAHPDRVRSLCLITPFVVASPRLRAVTRSWCAVAGEASPATLARFLAPWLFGDALLDDAAGLERTLRGLARSVERVPAATLERAARGIAAWSGSRTDDLARIDVPCLVIAGGADLLTPDAAAVAEAIPDARCEVLLEAGHAVTAQCPERVSELLLAHLQR